MQECGTETAWKQKTWFTLSDVKGSYGLFRVLQCLICTRFKVVQGIGWLGVSGFLGFKVALS